MSELSDLLKLIKGVVDEHNQSRQQEMNYKRSQTWKRKLAARTLDTPDVPS